MLQPPGVIESVTPTAYELGIPADLHIDVLTLPVFVR